MSAAVAPSSLRHALSVKTLGAFEVRAPDGALVLGLGQRRKSALLKYLASRPRAREAIETIAAALWPDSTAEAARVNVRGALHALRTSFAPYGAQHALTLEAGTIALGRAAVDEPRDRRSALQRQRQR